MKIAYSPEDPIEVTIMGRRYCFDCLESAIQALAVPCPHCRSPVIGRGVREGSLIYCSAYCVQCNRHETGPRFSVVDSG